MRFSTGILTGVMTLIASIAACNETEEATSESDVISMPTEILSPPVEHFKYGSIGTDKIGAPLALMQAMPLVCEDLLPPGTDPLNNPLEAFGLIYEPGEDLPIGFSKRYIPFSGVTLVGNNCSLCHTSTVRETPDSDRTLYIGAPAGRFDIDAYQSFMLGCISDPSRFNVISLNLAFNELGIFGPERLFAFNSTFVRAFTADMKRRMASVKRDGAWGPGRDDALNLASAILLGPEFVSDVPSPVDFPSVWNQKVRVGGGLHWDGSSLTARDRNIAVAVATGAPKSGVPVKSLEAVQDFLDTLEVPKYPFPIDEALAARGAKTFRAHCYNCHAEGGEQALGVTLIDEIGTDRTRNDNVTDELIAKTNSLKGPGWKITQFRRTNGYANGLLDGIWLRAPYLHNGSVPTLRDLLTRPSERPKSFYTGNDVYDQENVGFVSTVASEGNHKYNKFDTTRVGNGNGGHYGPEYGSDLNDDEIDELLEYLKTL